jgi:protein involved in polysaccharide export with SLBB domain/beta-lactamase regulating signal transducer with metallopeptidase domain
MNALNVFHEVFPSVSALGAHVWQSTLFAAACWLAAVLLKHNRASIRYSIWLAASVKFLFPVSVLVAIGAYAGSFMEIQAMPGDSFVRSTVSPLLIAVEQPVSQLAARPLSRMAESVSVEQVLATVWLSGAAGVAIGFAVRWRRLMARIGKTSSLKEGRELDALHRVQSRFGRPSRIRPALSASSIEPGVRGIVRPVLLLPDRITDRLSDEQLETIIAHELCHIRRLDNLTSISHLIVQTIFWFHPIVWWIGSRLVDERERSCDEYVLRMGSDPQVYASAILRVCEFCLAEPLAVVSRVTGANLTTRIEEIMTKRTIAKMGSARKFLLASAAVAFVVTPVLFGMTTGRPISQRPVESVSVPSRVSTVAFRPVERTAGPTQTAQARPPAPPTTIPPGRSTTVEQPPVSPAPREDYRLHAGDELDVLVWREPELRGRSVVRPDGKIGVPLVGDVPAEGLTPVQIQNTIQDQLSQFISAPHVTVIVATARKPQVTIQGAIHRPGAYLLEGRLNLLQLIAQAGGLSEFARRDQISVFREEGGAVRRHLFDYGAFLAGTNLDQNITLVDGDIVMVP